MFVDLVKWWCGGGWKQCMFVLLHLQHLLQVFPAFSPQRGQMGLFLTQGLLGRRQLGPHGLQLLFHLLHGAQQLLNLHTP